MTSRHPSRPLLDAAHHHHHHHHHHRRPSTMPSTPQSPRDDQPFVSAPPPPPHHPPAPAKSSSSDALPRQTTSSSRPMSSSDPSSPLTAPPPSAAANAAAQWRQSVHSLGNKSGEVALAAPPHSPGSQGNATAAAAAAHYDVGPHSTSTVKRGAAVAVDHHHHHHAASRATATSLPSMTGAVASSPAVTSTSLADSGGGERAGGRTHSHSHYVRQRQEKDKATTTSRKSARDASSSSSFAATTQHVNHQASPGLQLTTGHHHQAKKTAHHNHKKRSPASTSASASAGSSNKMIAHAASSMIGLGIDNSKATTSPSPRGARHAHKTSNTSSDGGGAPASSGADEPRPSTSTSGSSGRAHQQQAQQQQGQQQHIRVSYGGDDFYFATPPGSSPDPEFGTTLPQPQHAAGGRSTPEREEEAIRLAYGGAGGIGVDGSSSGAAAADDARAAVAVTSTSPSSGGGGRATQGGVETAFKGNDELTSPNDVNKRPAGTIRERRRQDKTTASPPSSAAAAAMSSRNPGPHYTGQLGGRNEDVGPFEREQDGGLDEEEEEEETVQELRQQQQQQRNGLHAAAAADDNYVDDQEIDSEDDSLLSDEGTDDDGDTEQAHQQGRPFSPPSVISSNDSPIIRVGKGGSRAGAGSGVMPPNRNSSMIQPGQQQQQAPLPPAKGPAPSLAKQQQQQPAQSTRRVAGGLSRSGTTAASSTAMTPSSSLGSRSMAAAAATSRPAAPARINSATSSGKPSSITSTSRKRGEFYRSAAQIGRRTNLTDWAPRARGQRGDSSYQSTGGGYGAEEDDEVADIENLPSFSSLRPGDRTSKPITRVEKDMEWSLRRLLSENVFKQLLDDPLGRHRFREFLDEDAENGAPMLLDDGSGGERPAPGSELLDFYFDLGQYERQARNLKSATEAIHDLYMVEDSPAHIPLPPTSGDDLYGTLRRAFDVEISLNPLQENIRRHLYRTSFQRFVRSMLIEENRVKLGAFQDEDDEYAGLGDCFCLTNPRAGTENPIVLASPGFAEVTGYPIKAILGRNCRFLQGPGTAPESVQRIRDALNAGRSITEVLLNYRRDGTPFFCLLSIIPLRDAAGQLAYFIGGQTNVSGTLAQDKGLGFLVGSGLQTAGTPSPESHNGYEVSPTLARHLQDIKQRDGTAGGGGGGAGRLGGLNTASSASLVSRRGGGRGDGSVSAKRRPAAAGAYDPQSSRGPVNDAFAQQSKHQSGRASKGGIMSRLFGGGGSSSNSSSPANGPPAVGSVSSSKSSSNLGGAGGGPKQRLLGAEGVVRSLAPARLGDQMESFADLYSRLIVFKRHRREIIFATVETIRLLNLPCNTAQQAYRSPLLHADVLDLMRGATKQETRELRAAVRDAVKMGRQISVRTGLRVQKRGAGSRFVDRMLGGAGGGGGELDGGLDGAATSEDMIIVTLHLTPLVDRENSSFAYVAVLG